MLIIFDPAHGQNVLGKCSPPLPYHLLLKYNDSPVIEGNRFKEYLFSRYIIQRVRRALHYSQTYPYVTEITVPSKDEIGLQARVNTIEKIKRTYNATDYLLLSLHCNAAGSSDKWETAKGISWWTTRGKTKSDQYATSLYEHFKSKFPEFTHRTDFTDGDPDYEANFKVLTSSIPSVLIEFGFQDNLADVERLLDPYIQNRIVDTFVDWCEMIVRKE